MDSTRPRETINATEPHSSSFELKVSSDQTIKDQLQLFPWAQVLALLIVLPSKLAGHWTLVCRHIAGFLWGIIHKLHKSYIYLSRPTKFILSTVGYLLLLLPLGIASNVVSLARTTVPRTHIQLFSCLSLVMDGTNWVFHPALPHSFRLCCKRTGLLPLQFPEHDGVRSFSAVSWSPLESVLEKEIHR